MSTVAHSDISDARDMLDEQRNRSAYLPEKQLLFQVLHQAWIDLNIHSYRKSALIFFSGASCKTICTLLGVDYEFVQQRVNTKPFKPPIQTRGRKRVWKHTFNSRDLSH